LAWGHEYAAKNFVDFHNWRRAADVAKALGIDVPAKLLALADEVIE
jgi:hypothetical protein